MISKVLEIDRPVRIEWLSYTCLPKRRIPDAADLNIADSVARKAIGLRGWRDVSSKDCGM